ncbi:MAG: hypothetical protein HQL38_07945 [Alphaproteobacteria bacterium]|nr:hypothetical protein [Alphaproteobacteria bacterium]
MATVIDQDIFRVRRELQADLPKIVIAYPADWPKDAIDVPGGSLSMFGLDEVFDARWNFMTEANRAIVGVYRYRQRNSLWVATHRDLVTIADFLVLRHAPDWSDVIRIAATLAVDGGNRVIEIDPHRQASGSRPRSWR